MSTARRLVLIAAAAVAVVVVGLAVVGVRAASGNPCKQAITSQLAYEFAHPDAPAAGEPPACNGVPKSVLLQYATDALKQAARH